MSTSLKSFAAATALATTLFVSNVQDADAGLISANLSGTIDNVEGFTTVDVNDFFSFDVTVNQDDIVDSIALNDAAFYSFLDLQNSNDNEVFFSVNGQDVEATDFSMTLFDGFSNVFSSRINVGTEGSLFGQDIRTLVLNGPGENGTGFTDGLSDISSFQIAFEEAGFSISGTIDAHEIGVIDTQPNPVPAPGTLVMFGVALAGIGARKLYSTPAAPAA